MKAKAKKPRRVVLGVGHPWFKLVDGADFVGLTRGFAIEAGWDWKPLKWGDLYNGNKIRLVAEVLK